MPVLPISNGRGEFADDAIAKLSAVMLDPSGSEIETLARRIMLEKTVEVFPPGFKLEVTAGDLAELVNSAREHGRTGERRFPRHGLLAFAILAINLACAEAAPHLVGVRRAGSILPRTSPATIKRAWSKFAPVASLWLAVDYKKPHDFGDWRTYLGEFLACAEEIRRAGESIFPHGQADGGKPLLDPEKTWKCPDDLALPSVGFKVRPLEDEYLAKLKKYRSPKSPTA